MQRPRNPLTEPGEALMRTPKGMRLAIGLFGRRNVGKSSLMNALTHQQASIVSSVAGTTADCVEKPMELFGVGPVLFIDTAGLDDDQHTIGPLRAEAAQAALDRVDLGIVVAEAGAWGACEAQIAQELEKRGVPFIVAFNKSDLAQPEGDAAACGQDTLPNMPHCATALALSAKTGEGMDRLREALLAAAPESFIAPSTIFGDVVEAGSTVVLVIPLDKEAPRGRLILPQVQAIRDLLDARCLPLCTTLEDLPRALAALAEAPALVVTDSQAFSRVAEIVPRDAPLTGFSVAFARLKGDLAIQAQGTRAIDALTEDSRVLIAEACTHHPIEEDIATVKIPRLLRARAGEGLAVDNVRGADFPADLSRYDLVIHCGGCMFNRRQVLSRIQACVHAGVPVSNYGLTLAYCAGIFERALEPFTAKNGA